MKTIIVLCQIGVWFGIANASDKNQIETASLISDYINDLDRPNLVSAYLCLDSEHAKLIYKNILSKRNYFSLSITNDFFANLPTFNSNYIDFKQRLMIIDMRCNTSVNFLNYLDRNAVFLPSYHWLMIEDWLDLENLQRQYRNFGFFIDSDVVIARNTHQQGFIMNPIYKIRSSDALIVENHVSTWNFLDRKLINLQSHLSFFQRRWNLRQNFITACTLITNHDSMNHLDDYRYLRYDPMLKINYIFIHHLSQVLNATSKFTFVNSIGNRKSNQSHYSGLTGVIERNEVDLTGIGIRMTADHLRFSKFLFPTMRPQFSFVFRQPPLTYVDNLYSMSFDSSLWISSGLLVGVVCIFLYISWTAEHSLNLGSEEQQFGIVEVLMISVSAVCQQGTTFEPRSFSGRIVLLVTFLALFFLYTAYSANIIVLLQSSSSKINSLSDLSKSRLKLGIENTSYNLHYLKSTSDVILKNIWQKKINPIFEKPHIYESSVGIRKMQLDQFAFGMPVNEAYRLTQYTFQEHEKCGLKTITYNGATNFYFASPKNSTFSDLIKTVFHQMQERGILIRGHLKAFAGKPKCESAGSNFVTVTLGDAYGAFYVFLFGVGLALMFLSLEVLQTKIQKKINLKSFLHESLKKISFTKKSMLEIN